MDFTFPNLKSADSNTTPPPTPQPFVKNTQSTFDINDLTEEEYDSSTSYKRTESRKRTLQHDCHGSDDHSLVLKKPNTSRFFFGSSIISTTSYNSKPNRLIYKAQQQPKSSSFSLSTMGPSLWCNSSCCTGKHTNQYFL